MIIRWENQGERNHKRTHCLFIDDLKVYQENHKKLEIVNELIVKASMDTGAVYGVKKKCAEIVFKNGKMIKGEGLEVLEERMKALDPNKMRYTNFLDVNKGKINVRKVMERVKKKIKIRLEQTDYEN